MGEESPEVTALKVANEEFLLTARQENDLLHKKKLNLEFDMKLVSLSCQIEMEHAYAKNSILKEYGPEHALMATIDRIRDRSLEALAKHQ